MADSIRPGCAALSGFRAQGARRLGAISAHRSQATSTLVSLHYQPKPRQAASTLVLDFSILRGLLGPNHQIKLGL